MYYSEIPYIDGYLDSQVSDGDGMQMVASTNKPPSFTRKFVELMFYVTLLVISFPSLTGLQSIPNAIGALLMVAGFIAFTIMVSGREGIPISVWFAIMINVSANFSQVIGHQQLPIIGEGLIGFFQWLCQLIMVCYLLQNDAAGKRVFLVFVGIFIISIFLGAEGLLETSAVGAERLSLKETGHGAAFANSNAIAYMSGIFSITCLFWSLRCKKLFRPILWLLVAIMTLILLKTASRGGLLVFICGLALLMFAVLSGRDIRLGGIVQIVVAVIVVLNLGYMVAPSLDLLRERMDRGSPARTGVYQAETIGQLCETLIIGGGSRTLVKQTGVIAHNSYINTHLSFGGITALLYLTWLFVLGIRVLRMFRHHDIPFDIKMKVMALYGMSLGFQFFSNQGFMAYMVIYATAVIERYTFLYSGHKLRERKFAEYDLMQDQNQLSRTDTVGW